jgi:hypothetical protein
MTPAGSDNRPKVAPGALLAEVQDDFAQMSPTSGGGLPGMYQKKNLLLL